MHRVVIYRDDAAKASQMVAYTTYPPLGSADPRDLWKWLANFEEKTGGDVLAIAHSGNLSNGIMFPLEAQWNGRAFDEDYVTQRHRWEPLYETTQIKGDGETHSFLSPDDEFADYETWDVGNLDLSEAKTDAMLAGEYAREALKRGLVIESRLGTNPYKFGQVGSTDSRMGVRFFGGWNFTTTDLDSRTPAFTGYSKGVPMGGDLPVRAGSGAPTFMVYAIKDPIGGNLDRIQIVKGWMDSGGDTHEMVYDVAWSGDRKPGKNGKLPAVGNTVDAATANFTNTIGASELGAVWTDPDFDAAHKAVYYARVIEIPTPRWSTYDAFRFGVPIPKGAPVSTQERAYTSPIWYTP